MNLEQIEVLLKEAKVVTQHDEFVIIGSLSILGFSPHPPKQMVMSIDVDMYLKNDPYRTSDIYKKLGQGSEFENANGYYADPVSPKLASLPEGWEARLIEYNFGDVKAFFLDPEDAAVSKYIRGDERDLRWIHAGLEAGILKMITIERRIGTAPTLDGELEAARDRIEHDKKYFETRSTWIQD